MNEQDLDQSFERVAARLVALSRQAIPDPQRRAELRHDLMRRHVEARLARANVLPWSARLKGMKRVALVGVPALLAATAMTVMLWVLPVSRQQTAQPALAERLQVAFARTAPTVTSWQWTVRTTREGQPRVDRSGARLTHAQSLYVAHGHTYLYSDGHWQLVVPPRWQASAPSPWVWQWAFAGLPARLATHRSVKILPAQRIDGRLASGVVLAKASSNGQTVQATAWVDQSTGLVLRLDRVEMKHGRVVERDVAEYTYSKRRG